mmetsp:Transcript_45998/g.80833  ORF Transcript_45998/g.80833 Transcript_45998/m.80833 type:complete len:379 (-) Transcript_45998:46-1182(-)
MACAGVEDNAFLPTERTEPSGCPSGLSATLPLSESTVDLAAQNVKCGVDIVHGKLDELLQRKTEDECETEFAESVAGNHDDDDDYDSLNISKCGSCGLDSEASESDVARYGSHPECVSEVEEADVEIVEHALSGRKKVKLIFLDMDGPVAPYKNGLAHNWCAEDDFSDAAYAPNLAELRRVIDACGGPEVVKVVLSSSWRTDEERMPWLKAQFARCGIDMIGHTDVIHTFPQSCNEMLRNVEIYRVLQSRTVGMDGPYFDEEADTNKFRPWQMPLDWEISNWIVIDDLRMDRVPASHWQRSQLLVGYLPLDEEKPEESGSGWYHVRDGFARSISEWYQDFASQHFIYADPEAGIARTRGAAELAIQLLNTARGRSKTC